MKVKQRGAKPIPRWCGEWTCRACGTIYEVLPSDEDSVRYHDDQRGGEWLVADCQICGESRNLYRHSPKSVYVGGMDFSEGRTR